jgi:hypothetical protein
VGGAILMPGRIGLVAVDALALKLPVLTTDWKYHAPEAEYLAEGHSMHILPNDPYEFAKSAISFLATSRSHEKNDIQWQYPTIEAMVNNFAEGIVSMLQPRF